MDPVAAFTPPDESRHGLRARQFPLELLARKADNFLNSTFCNLPVVQEMEEAGLLEMSAADARARRIVDGDVVRVFNDRGDITLRARVDGAVQAGVVSAKLHWAKLNSGSRNINVLTSEKLTDLGNSATFYSVLVEVELVKHIPRASDRRADLDAAGRSKTCGPNRGLHVARHDAPAAKRTDLR